MKYALIGCGRIALNHVKAVVDNDLEFIAACDIDPKKVEDLWARSGYEKAEQVAVYTDHRQMLEDHPEIELVSIATESGKHAQIALDCIEKGVHVIIEKPMAMSLKDADAIIAAAEKHDVRVAACHQNRFNIAVQNMRGALESGRFGRLSHGTVHVRWNRNQGYYTQAPWRGTWEQDGGALMNQCIHGIDLLRWSLGDEIVAVYGQTRQQFHDYLEAEDLGVAIIQFKNGAIGTVEGTTNVFPKNLEETLYVFGEEGTVKLGGKSCNHIDVWQFADEREEDARLAGYQEETTNVYGNGHTPLFKDMMEAIREHRAPYVDAKAGKRALELVLAIYKSQKTGEVVRFPMKDFASTDMAGEFHA